MHLSPLSWKPSLYLATILIIFFFDLIMRCAVVRMASAHSGRTANRISIWSKYINWPVSDLTNDIFNNHISVPGSQTL